MVLIHCGHEAGGCSLQRAALDSAESQTLGPAVHEVVQVLSRHTEQQHRAGMALMEGTRGRWVLGRSRRLHTVCPGSSRAEVLCFGAPQHSKKGGAVGSLRTHKGEVALEKQTDSNTNFLAF